MRPQLYTFPAEEASLPLLLEHLTRVGSALRKEVRLRAQTALEELFANTVKHGYADPAVTIENCVWLAVWTEDDALHLCYDDAAPRFNPFDNLETVAESTLLPLDTRPVGGLGRLMVRGLSDTASYAWIETEFGRHNRIELTFKPREPWSVARQATA